MPGSKAVDAAPVPRETSEPDGVSLEPDRALDVPQAELDRPLLPPQPGEVARVVVVIDDLGRSLQDLERLEALGQPVTYAVLPFESRTPDVVDWLHRRSLEYLLHLPMEGSPDANPGPGALFSAMNDAELIESTRLAILAVPGAIGVNNHMGSVLTQRPAAMQTVLAAVKRSDLLFLDSRTTPDSVVPQIAQSLDLPVKSRDVFLDRDKDADAIEAQWFEVLQVARKRGVAIAIGHPYPETLDVLSRRVPEAAQLGYRFVRLSSLYHEAGEVQVDGSPTP